MNTISFDQPLSDAELDRLQRHLAALPSPTALNLEGLDGLIAAAHCSPELILPSEVLEAAWGADPDGGVAVPPGDAQSEEMAGLILRHWNTVGDALGRTLDHDDVYLPILLEDEHGVAHANDWAQGFLRGVAMRPGSWNDLLDDEDKAGSIVPMMALAHENDPDPELSAGSFTPERRETIIAGMIAGLTHIYRYFAPHRRTLAAVARQAKPARRVAPKVGRNEPCPCGSGRKFKHCHGGAMGTGGVGH